MAQNPTMRLRGQIKPGMFSNERVFLVEHADEEPDAVIVPESFVEERDGVPTIRVVLLLRSEDRALVFLLGEQLFGDGTAWVSERDLIPT